LGVIASGRLGQSRSGLRPDHFRDVTDEIRSQTWPTSNALPDRWS